MSAESQPTPDKARAFARQALEYGGGLLIVFLVAAVVFPIFAQAKMGGKPTCTSHLSSLLRASNMYKEDNDDRLPIADSWTDGLLTFMAGRSKHHYFEQSVRDQRDIPLGDFGYSFRESASGAKASSIADHNEFVLVFDSTLLGRNAHSDLTTLPNPGRHSAEGGVSVDNIAYLDGHTRAVTMP